MTKRPFVLLLLTCLFFDSSFAVQGAVDRCSYPDSSQTRAPASIQQLLASLQIPFTVVGALCREVPLYPEFAHTKNKNTTTERSKSDGCCAEKSHKGKGIICCGKVDAPSARTGTAPASMQGPCTGPPGALSAEPPGSVAVSLLAYFVLLRRSNLPSEDICLVSGERFA